MLFLANNFQEGTYLLHWLWVELDFSEILVVVVIIVRQPVTLNQAFFWTVWKKLKDEKTQASRK